MCHKNIGQRTHWTVEAYVLSGAQEKQLIEMWDFKGQGVKSHGD